MKKINNKKFQNSVLKFFIIILILLVSYSLDKQANLFFKNFRLPLLDIVLGIITNFGILILVMVLIPSIMLYQKNKKSVYLIWLTFFISFILAFIMKTIFLRQRPIGYFNYPFINIIDYSFPSMHSMIAFSLLPILLKPLPKQRIFWAVFAFLVVFTRIYFNFHFLSDVVFGAIVGYFVGKQIICKADKFFPHNHQ